MAPIPGVKFLNANLYNQETKDQLREQLGDKRVDVFLSDMAPSITGVRDTDQMRSLVSNHAPA